MDIRGIPVSAEFGFGRLIAVAGAPAGFTVDKAYMPLALAVDVAPANPVVYVATVDDNGVLRSLPASMFAWRLGGGS